MSGFATPYRGYDVLDKWDSPSWNEQTREAIRQRLDELPPRRFLSPEQWRLLEMIAERLIPQPDRERPVPIVPWIDEKLHKNQGPGYRYADMPPMREAWRTGLDAIAAEARSRHGKDFAELAGEEQDALLHDVRTFLEDIVLRDRAWRHNDPEYSDCERQNADSHLRGMMMGQSLCLQVRNSAVLLGTWQSIILAEFDGPRSRSMSVQVSGI